MKRKQASKLEECKVALDDDTELDHSLFQDAKDLVPFSRFEVQQNFYFENVDGIVTRGISSSYEEEKQQDSTDDHVTISSEELLHQPQQQMII